MILFPVAVVALIGFAIYLGIWAAVAWGMTTLRLFRQPWQMALAMPVMMAALPAFSIWFDKLAANECFARNGPDDLSCGGELGGTMIAMFKVMIIVLSITLGPFAFSSFGRRLLRPKPVFH
jgi:hypothetical protein